MIRTGLCLAAFGDQTLDQALEATAPWADLCLDVPTDSTFKLLDITRYGNDAQFRGEVRSALAGRVVTCVSNSRDSQLLLGPHGAQTDKILKGRPSEKVAHARTAIRASLHLAHDLQVPHVRVMPGCPDFANWLSWWGSETSWMDNIHALHDHLQPFVELAANLGVTLLLEPHPKQVIYDPASVQQLFDAVPEWQDQVAVCLDPANLAAAGHDPVAAVAHLARHVAAVHVKDLQVHTLPNPPHGPGWSRYGPHPPIRFRTMGLGQMPWTTIIAALQDEHFDGVIYLEHEDTLISRTDGIPRALTHLQRLLPAHESEGRTW